MFEGYALNNCAIRTRTADGAFVGRCWYTVVEGKCPLHGNVSATQDHYAKTGQLTNEILK